MNAPGYLTSLTYLIVALFAVLSLARMWPPVTRRGRLTSILWALGLLATLLFVAHQGSYGSGRCAEAATVRPR